MTKRETDVLVLGGGVIGLACAHYLQVSGRTVTVLDQGRIGGGSSHGNCGTLTPSHATPLAMPGMIGTALRWMLKRDAPLRVAPRVDPRLWRWLGDAARLCNWRDFERLTAAKAPFLVRSRALIEQLVHGEGLDCEFRTDGTLYVYRDADAFAVSHWLPRALAAVGIAIEPLDGAGVEAREPALKPGVAGGYFHPGDASLRPDRYVAELARVVRGRGGELVENRRVEGFARDGARITRVCCDGIDYAARDIVFALGAWSPRLARGLGLNLPIQPGKGYSITYTRPASCPRVPLVLREASVCVTAWNSGYRLGSTMEFAGYDASLNRARLDALRRGAAAYLHEPEGPQRLEEWFGWRPMTPDDLPIIGRPHGIDNLCLATGHGMLGVTMSALTGLLVSEIVEGAAPGLDPAAYSPGRFRA
ncbi:MAG: FAD-dependent oxidoreductase [Xanthomonadales bacterium]|nr:FAD-dependent oxidoreductase [Xanthomonadales bacterium]